MMNKFPISLYILILLFSLIFMPYAQNKQSVTNNCRQIIVVLTDSASSTKGYFFRFERINNKENWIQMGNYLQAVLGRNGLGSGNGLETINTSELPTKVEGDGRSPAGIFKLGSAFGYANTYEMNGLKIPYIQITETCECVDDKESEYYNQIVNRNNIDTVDWHSSEKMFFADIWYEQGIVIEYNTNSISHGAGSCIFLHNWSSPNETSAGCTEIEPSELKNIINWLDSSANPLIVQLTKTIYENYKSKWELPEVIFNN